MVLIYKTAIFLYTILIRCASLFNDKAKLFIAGRKDWKEALLEKVDEKYRYLWFHCASLGEFEQGRPVIEEIRKMFPEYKIILTFFSPSGYEIRKNYEGADIVSYLPVDTRQNAASFIEIVNPEKVFFIKYEFWYHYITELKRQSIPLYLVSAKFRKNQHFFTKTPWGKWSRKILNNIEHLFVQDEASGKLLKSIGLEQVSVSGDTRFDRVAAIAGSAKKIPLVDKFRGEFPLIIAGSTWKPDEELLIKFINQSENIRFIIAPHEVSATNINRIHQLLTKPAISLSKASETAIGDYEVLITDTIGLLSSMYQYGNIAYIGGGFGVGIHNILEAATFGMPIVFGPNYNKFKEALDLISMNGAFPVTNERELKSIFSQLITGEEFLQTSGETCKKYVEKNVGSTKFIIKKVFNTEPLLD